MKKYILTFILAAIVGIIGGLQGNAGSVYILTGLLLFNIVSTQRMAAGTTLLYTSVPLTIGAAYQYYKKGDIDFKLAGILIVTAFFFSILGAKLNYIIPQKYTLYSTSIMLFLSSLFFFRKAYLI
jgi:uncharacterized membrane protein YfcA|tara:strand:- start:132 stop:506 length:375 start_codon:yes stop_codon:yes gene_type:complete